MNVFTLGIAAGIGFLSQFLNQNTPFGRGATYRSNAIHPNAQPDFTGLIDLRFRNEITAERFVELSKNIGYDEYWANKMYETAKQYPPLMEYVKLYRRKIIDLPGLKAYANLLKVPVEEVNLILKATEYFPSAPDLVRFAVREVYTDAVRKKFGMDEDRPPRFMLEAAKAGLPDEQAANFWAAHWELPSPLQGFAMLHRRIIDKGDLQLLLKSLDVMPYWRDKIIQLSYKPLTRVDVRRMYSFGTLNKDGVKDSYLDLGYSPEKADLMTDFTLKYESNETTGLTRSNVVAAYKDSIITIQELKEFLEAFDYSPEVINFWLATAEYDKLMSRIKHLTDDLIERYQMGAITIDGVRTELLNADLPSIYVDRVITDVIEFKARRTKVPGKADLFILNEL